MRRRPRRNRQSHSIRRLVRENAINPSHFVMPVFCMSGQNRKEPISSMPHIFKYSLDLLISEIKRAYDLGIHSIALFPVIDDKFKDPYATYSYDENCLTLKAIKQIKDSIPEVTIFSDVAMDPYSSDGHDGVVRNGRIINDETLGVLASMAIAQANAGSDFVSPSDMMDGRVGYIRDALDREGHQNVGILSYTAKYASAFYGPFRDALDSAPQLGDKKSYQMDPANSLEALRELKLDESEGADIIMIKPALTYLDIIKSIKENTHLPVAAYFVSGEYSMIMAAASNGWVNKDAAFKEALMAIKRAGADIIFSYNAMEFVEKINFYFD